jgi:hypothetical protein
MVYVTIYAQWDAKKINGIIREPKNLILIFWDKLTDKELHYISNNTVKMPSLICFKVLATSTFLLMTFKAKDLH